MNISILRTGVALAAAAMLCGAAAAQVTTVQRFNGVLGGSDSRDTGNRFYDDYQVQFAAGQRVRVTASRAEGSSLDPYLEIYSPSGGEPIATDDDSGGYPNARAEFTTAAAGVYFVRVRGFSSGSTGLYDLVIEPLASGPTPRVYRLDAVNQGRFDTSVPRLNGDGVHYVDYRIDLNAGDEILLRLDSDAFDPYLYVYSAGDENGTPLAADDDGGDGLNSSITFRAPRTGTYTVRAAQLAHADGAYVLRMNRLR